MRLIRTKGRGAKAAAETLEKARPVLAVMSKAILHLGPSGSGALMKLINNFLCGAQAASLAEAIAIIEKAGRMPKPVWMSEGAPQSGDISNGFYRYTLPYKNGW